MEARWQDCREFWERLRWARLRYAHKAGDIIFRPTDAALTLGVKPVTYRTWEQPKEDGGRVPPLETVQFIASKLGVNWIWLLSGQQSPLHDPQVEDYIQVVATKLPDVPEERRQDALAAMRAVLESFARKAS